MSLKMKLLWQNFLLLLCIIHTLCEEDLKIDELVESFSPTRDFNLDESDSVDTVPSFQVGPSASILDFEGSREEISEQRDLLYSSKINLFPDLRGRSFNEHIYDDDVLGYGK